MQRPDGIRGLWHVALQVNELEATERFYTQLLGMRVEWRPDADNVYLTSGADNLALHRIAADAAPPEQQRLDHIGFILQRLEQVDEWHAFLKAHGVSIAKEPKTHRDGARSFYCRDPDGNLVQMIYHPPLID
jgi:catechol 2,3-dioxygenase-like lactoylglutathione lyase family enzyme